MVVVFIVGLALGHVGGWYLGRNRGRFDERFKAARADGQFQACAAALNTLKVKYADALMRLEDKR